MIGWLWACAQSWPVLLRRQSWSSWNDSGKSLNLEAWQATTFSLVMWAYEGKMHNNKEVNVAGSLDDAYYEGK